MKKNFKKTAAAAAAFSLAVTSVSIPAAIAAENGITVNGNTAEVTSDKAGVAIVASYGENGRLEGVTTKNVQAGTTESVSVNEGDKVMLWEGLTGENTTPIVDAVNVTKPEPTGTPDTTAEPTETPDTTAKPTETPDTTAEPTMKPIGETLKFDFGSGDSVTDGYYKVTKDTTYNSNIVDGHQFGLVGTEKDDYKLGAYVDGIDQKEGQVIVLKEGSKGDSSSADNDYIGSAPQEEANYKVSGNYPIRFNMKAENNHYYKVKVNLTGLDQTKEANATVYSERRHPIITDETIPAGESKSVEFVATLQNVYIKVRDGSGDITYKDDRLNVTAVGDNVAVSSIEVTEVEHQPTMWLYTDSTGCDYASLLPYFGLQNYGGTGQWLTKYLPEGITISNQGDGGINAADSAHWAAARDNISAGDYVYVQYGHNHKDDGPVGYLQAIPKYYEKAHSVGANTLYVGPIDRHNSSQYDASTNTWSSTLNGFSKAAKYYTEILITGGKAKADEFVKKAKEEADGKNVADSTYAWADEVIAAGITADGAKDVAFVDLNQPTLDWLSRVCEDVKTIRGAEKYESNASDYYFRGIKGGSIDGTHANDGGADNTASFFFDEAKKTIAEKDTNPIAAVEANVLTPLVTNMRTATPYKVTEDIVKAGPAPAGWPDVYVADNLPELPTEIKDIKFADDGSVESVVVNKREAKMDMSAYGIVEITIYNADGTEKGKVYTVRQVDNTVNGAQTITEFRGDTKLADGDTYTAIVRKGIDTGTEEGIIVDTENPAEYSAWYVPTNIEQALILDEDGNETEDFDYYGAVYGGDNASKVSDFNKWNAQGSSGKTLTLDQDGDRKYANVISDGAKNGSAGQGSFFLAKQFTSDKAGTAAEIGTTGKYMIEMDMEYISGSGAVVQLSNGFSNKSPFIGETIDAFTIGNNGVLTIGGKEAGGLNTNSWATVKYILDMDYGKASLSVAGGTPVEIEVPNYATLATTINPEKLTHFVISANKVAFGVKISNLTVAKLKSDKLPEKTLTLKSSDDTKGTVSSDVTKAVMNTVTTVNAVPNKGYIFVGWKNEAGEVVSTDASYTFRLHDDIELTAQFDVQNGVDAVNDFKLTSDKTTLKNAAGATAALTTEDVVDAAGNPVEYAESDVTWSCDESGVTVENGVVTLGEDFVIDENTTKDIVVKAVINGIEKQLTIKVYSYAYFESANGGKVTSAWDGPVSEAAGRNGLAFPAGGKTSTLTLPEAVSLDGKTTISYIAAGSGAAGKFCGQPRYIEIYDTNGNKVVNEVIGYSWGSMTVGGTVGGSAISDGTNFDNAVVMNAWSEPVIITLNGDGTGVVSFNGATANVTVNSSATDIASIKFSSKSGAPDYTQRGLSLTDITIEK